MQKLNFTMVPNEVIDEHLSELSGAEIKVLLAISRYTTRTIRYCFIPVRE